MKRTILRLLASATLVSVLATAFAVPAMCYTYVNPGPGSINYGGSTRGITLANEIPQKIMFGGQVASIEAVYYCDHYEYCDNQFYRGCNQYTATGTSSSGCEMPYSMIATASPAAKAILTNTAKSLGLVPGDAFGIEIGKFTCYGGYTPCTRLNIPMSYEIQARSMTGGAPVMLALLPNGAVTMLNMAEFDQSCSNQWYVDGTRMYYLHTMYPNAVYMMAFAP